ncbi:MAG: hypothetical protein KAS86_00565 [Candidatus Omnitrophica bacterium]|nr:hypothetical protein [Candidatus Omnitrophota bacterium]
MVERRGFFNPTFSRRLFFITLSVLVSWFLILRFDGIAAFSINDLTDYGVSYDRSGGGLFSFGRVQGRRLELTRKGFMMTAETVCLALRPGESVRARRLICDCRLEGVRFHGEKEKGGASSAEALISMPFGPNWRYETMVFTVILGGGCVKIDSFRAFGDDISVKGDGELAVEGGDIVIDISVLVSPEVSESLLGDLREMFFIREDNGWDSLNLNVKGNIRTAAFELRSDLFEMNVRNGRP